MKSKIFLILTILWMGVIFYMSAKPADESSNMSLIVGRFIAHVIVPGFDDMTEADQNAFVEKINYPVRKCAHATEYAILGFFTAGTLFTGERIKKNWKKIIISILVVAIYASTDEIHQLFVEGRAGAFTDVLIDTSGGVVGTFVMFGIQNILISIKSKKDKKHE